MGVCAGRGDLCSPFPVRPFIFHLRGNFAERSRDAEPKLESARRTFWLGFRRRTRVDTNFAVVVMQAVHAFFSVAALIATLAIAVIEQKRANRAEAAARQAVDARRAEYIDAMAALADEGIAAQRAIARELAGMADGDNARGWEAYVSKLAEVRASIDDLR